MDGGVDDAGMDDAGAVDAGCDGGLCCPSGTGDCNTTASDGCEQDLLTSTAHCGACGAACGSGETCESGECRCAGGVACGGGALCYSGGCNEPPTGTLVQPSPECVDEAMPGDLRFRVQGPTGSTVEIWAQQTSCPTEGPLLLDSGGTIAGLRNLVRPYGGLPCTAVEYGGWEIWGVIDGVSTPHVPLSWLNSGRATPVAVRFCGTVSSFCAR